MIAFLFVKSRAGCVGGRARGLCGKMQVAIITIFWRGGGAFLNKNKISM
jgi:hypothetical protein